MQVAKKRELKAILNSDLSELLNKFSQWDNFVNEQIMCSVCNTVITQENIGSIKLSDGKLIFTCNKSSCYNQLVKLSSETLR